MYSDLMFYSACVGGIVGWGTWQNYKMLATNEQNDSIGKPTPITGALYGMGISTSIYLISLLARKSMEALVWTLSQSINILTSFPAYTLTVLAIFIVVGVAFRYYRTPNNLNNVPLANN